MGVLVGARHVLLIKQIGLMLSGPRYKDELLEIGDLAIHDEEAFPEKICPGDVLVMDGAHRTRLDDDLAAPRDVPPSPEPSTWCPDHQRS
jgi:hypothetical protein